MRNPGRDGARPRPCETQVVHGPGLLRLLSDLILLSPSDLSPSDLLLDFLNFFLGIWLVRETVRLGIFSNFFGL